MTVSKTQPIPDSDAPILDISSLIDVCFLLLIYFLVTSTILPREQQLQTNLPSNSPSMPEQVVIDPLFIHVTPHGTISAGGLSEMQELDRDSSSRSLPLLKTRLDLYLDAARSMGSAPIVKLSADDGAIQQRVIDVLDTLELAGVRTVAFSDPGFR